MSTKTIPERTFWVCDCCKTEKESEARPKRWSSLRLQRDAYDFQDNAVADASVHLTLCETCTHRVSTYVNLRLPLLQDLDITLDQPPGPESGLFVDVHTMTGKSTCAGKWVESCGGYSLRLKVARTDQEEKS